MADFPRYPLSGEQAKPAAPDPRSLNAPYAAGQAAIDVAERAVDLGVRYLGKLADEAAQAEKLAVSARIDQTRALFIDDLGAKTEGLRKSGNYSELRDKWLSEGGQLNALIESYAGQFKPGIEQETARAELMQAGASMFPRMLADARDSANAIDRANLNLSLRDDLAEVASARGQEIPDALKMALGVGAARYERSVQGGSISIEKAREDQDKHHHDLSNEAYQAAIATAEDIFTRSNGNFGDTRAELERQKKELVPLFDKIIGNNLSAALDNAIQQYDAKARAKADAAEARYINREVSAIRAIGTNLEQAARRGDRARFAGLVKQIEDRQKNITDTTPVAIQNALAAYSGDSLEFVKAKLDESAVPREWADVAVTQKPPSPLPATPSNIGVVDAAYSTRMDVMKGFPLTERLGYTNAVINNTGMVTKSMLAQYDYAFSQIGTNPQYGPVMIDALDDLEALSPSSYGQFIKTKTGQQAAMFKAQYDAELAAARSIPGNVPDINAITLAAHKAASAPADQTVIETRRKYMEQEGLDTLSTLANRALADMIQDKLGGASGFDPDEFKASKNSGINGEVYRRIVQKTTDYFVYATGGLNKNPDKNVEAAMSLAASDVLDEYRWSGTEFKRGSPLSMGAGPGDNPRIYQNIRDAVVDFGGAGDAEADAVVRKAQYLGGVSGGWVLYVNNNVVTNDKGDVFIYKPNAKPSAAAAKRAENKAIADEADRLIKEGQRRFGPDLTGPDAETPPVVVRGGE